MRYHLAAFITVTIWSITYISSKVVLQILTPTELTLYRFIIGYICLLIIKPPKSFKLNIKDDFYIIISAFFGIFLYYIIENSSTSLTQPAYVSIIVSTIPLITSILAHFMNRDEKFSAIQIITFIMAFSGITIVILGGASLESGYLLGNILALLGAIVFSFYNIFLKRIDPNINPLEKARKINFYGLIMIIILFLITPHRGLPEDLLSIKYMGNVIFLGVIASSICILLWGYSITGIGSVKTSKYIYLAPLITSVVSNVILHESYSLPKIIGMILIIGGMLIPHFLGADRSKLKKIA